MSIYVRVPSASASEVLISFEENGPPSDRVSPPSLLQADTSGGQQHGPADGQDGDQDVSDHRDRHEAADHDHQRVGGAGVDRLQAQVGPRRLRRRQAPPRALQRHLAARHCAVQQVSALSMVYVGQDIRVIIRVLGHFIWSECLFMCIKWENIKMFTVAPINVTACGESRP